MHLLVQMLTLVMGAVTAYGMVVVPICPNGYTTAEDDRCYFVVNPLREKTTSWSNAVTFCSAIGGKLASVTEENVVALRKLVKMDGNSLAIYYVDANNIRPDGTWVRSGGVEEINTNDRIWAENEPVADDRHCAALTEDGQVAAECINKNPALNFGAVCEQTVTSR
jgi:hypothetical protein